MYSSDEVQIEKGSEWVNLISSPPSIIYKQIQQYKVIWNENLANYKTILWLFPSQPFITIK